MKKYYNLFSFAFLCLGLVTIKAQIKDGDLIKGTSENIYLVADGKACWIPNMGIFDGLKLDAKSVKVIDDAKLKKLPKGWLVFKNQDRKYFLNINGNSALIGDSLTFVGTGISDKYVFHLDDKIISNLPSVPFVVKGKAITKYLLINGKVCQFSSDKIFKALGFDPAMVASIGDKAIAVLQKASLLLKGESDKIYVIEKDKRRWVTSQEVFKKNNYDWKSVYHTNDKFVNSIPEGKPIN